MRVFVFLLLCVFITPVMAEINSTPNTNELDFIMQKTDVTSLIIDGTLTSIEKQLARQHPDIVEKNKDKTDEEKLIIYRSFLAQASFDWYKYYFMNKLIERSEQTGRELKKQTSVDGKSTFWWLDEGILESHECKSEKGLQTCQFPDNFEQVFLSVESTGSDTDLVFAEDNKETNTTLSATLLLSNDTTNAGINDIMLSVSSYVMPYDKYADYRQKEWSYFKGIEFKDPIYWPKMTLQKRTVTLTADYSDMQEKTDVQK